MFDLTFIEKRCQELAAKNEKIKKILESFGHSVPEIKKENDKIIQAFDTSAKSLKELKIACVMDRFTYYSFKDECNLLELTLKNWKEEIDTFLPDILFIESAWEGKDKIWYRKIANGSKEFFEMASYCQEKNIPIVFWCKEDPVHTDTFMPVAKMADFIFTTDIDCIKRYKAEVGHDNVFLLHFAAQPILHNPIEKYDRKDKFCFAGAYYHRFKERCEIFDRFADVFIEKKGLDIYDRNYKNARPEHAFPSCYQNHILGMLSPEEIDVAYKGYNYGINMNSENQSQTMFARRVFEMLASNTITIGNYSRGLKNLFGDLTICTNDSSEMERQLNLFCIDETTRRKYRLLGLRNVLSQHLYEDRLNYIASKIYQKSLKPILPRVILFAFGKNGVESFKKQSYENKILYVIDYEIEGEDNIISIDKEKASEMMLSAFENAYIGILNEKDYYGKNYLYDMMLSLRYGDFDGIGKSAYYSSEDGIIKLNNSNEVYKPIQMVDLARGLIKSSIITCSADKIFEMKKMECQKGIATDEFHYCENYKETVCEMVDDLCIFDSGIQMKRMEEIAENIHASEFVNKGQTIIGQELKTLINGKLHEKLEIKEGKEFELLSKLTEQENEYLYFEKLYHVNDFIENDSINFIFNCIGGTEVLGVCIFLDENKKKISPEFPKANRFTKVKVPIGAVYFKLGLRIRGDGSIKIKNIGIGVGQEESGLSAFLSRSNVLILTNQYPAYDNLYRNMFVHKRMTAYKEDGFTYDVMKMNIYAKDNFREFEGINVLEGYCERLENILSTGNIDTVCVHFLDKQMWDVLKNFGKKLRILVWLHGAEIQPWWRREYNYNTEEELTKAKKDSEIRMAFWKEVFSEYTNYNIKFVFVSQYFADEIFEDNKIVLPKDDYYIIHNCIDTDMFSYVEKDAEQRKKILSIRPYASNKYANDLSVKAVMELSKKEFFQGLEFLFVGSGDLFDEILKPIKGYQNVTLQKTFLRQEKISELHKEYGIFLTPTRMDAQGVSRDEAMSSGMVPVTNAITAIPEFVDENCGILADGEDYKGMAEGIERLYQNPDEFLRLSKNAAERVRSQTSKEFTIVKEEKLINGKG